MKKIISHTNDCFFTKKNGKTIFLKKIKQNNFNHKINYELFNEVDFVPKLLSWNKKQGELEWEFIESKKFEKLEEEEIKKLAETIKKIPDLKINFPKFNLASRIKEYRKIINEKNIKIKILDEYYKKINLILSKMDKTTPMHGDIWPNNVLIDSKNKIYIIDWEYASLGDIHFELAYTILSFRFNKKEEEIFLNAYGIKNYDENFLKNHKILVNYYTILWIHSQDEIFFDDKEFIDALENSKKR